ncbi:MAG: DUF2125 domain-containing protein [Pseudomonadota bacterium]
MARAAQLVFLSRVVFCSALIWAAAATAHTQSAVSTLLDRLNAQPALTLSWEELTATDDTLTYHALTATLAGDSTEATVAFGDLLVEGPGTAAERVRLPGTITLTATRATPIGPQALDGTITITDGLLAFDQGGEALTLTAAEAQATLTARHAATSVFEVTVDTLTGAATLPADADQTAALSLAAAVLRVDGNTTAPDAAPLALSLTARAPRTTADMTPTLTQAGLQADEVTFTTDIPGLPHPVSLRSGAADYALSAAQDGDTTYTELTAAVTDYDLTEDLWATLDPDAALDRTPGRIAVDLAFDAQLSDGATTVGGLTIAEATLALAGFTGAATGQIDTLTRDPNGAVTVTLIGLTDLLGAMANAGLIEPTQAFGAQFMLGLFAQPGPDDGSLIIPVTLGPDRALTVNGQRLR